MYILHMAFMWFSWVSLHEMLPNHLLPVETKPKCAMHMIKQQVSVLKAVLLMLCGIFIRILQSTDAFNVVKRA